MDYHFPTKENVNHPRLTCPSPNDNFTDDTTTNANTKDNVNVRGLLEGLMEISLLVLSRAAQIRAGLWKRNGQGMHDQVLNYAEPPFCRALRDADLTLLQFSIVSMMQMGWGDGIAYFTNLSLHRFGLLSFCGFRCLPISNSKQLRRRSSSHMSSDSLVHHPLNHSHSMEDNISMDHNMNVRMGGTTSEEEDEDELDEYEDMERT